MRLRVIDGGKAPRKAIVQTFGATALIQRCQEHKRRNVLDPLPEHMQAGVKRALKGAWSASDADLGRRQLQCQANSLQAKHSGAAASLREGLEETLTVQEPGITGSLYRTLRTTNPIKNLNGSVARYCRNVKRWGDGQMALRWVASALSDAAGRMRKLRGCSQMRSLVKAQSSTLVGETATLRKAAWHYPIGAVTCHGSTGSGTTPAVLRPRLALPCRRETVRAIRHRGRRATCYALHHRERTS